MSDIIETIKQGADDLLSGIDQKGQIRSAIEGIRSQWSEMDRRRKVSTLERQIKTQRAEMKQLTEALGLQTLSLYETGIITNPELSRLCERITELRSEIETQKAQVEQIKAEAQAQAQALAEARAQQRAARTAQACPQCGDAVTANDAFCPNVVRSKNPQRSRHPPLARNRRPRNLRTRSPRRWCACAAHSARPSYPATPSSAHRVGSSSSDPHRYPLAVGPPVARRGSALRAARKPSQVPGSAPSAARRWPDRATPGYEELHDTGN
jgi:hypothetical protein